MDRTTARTLGERIRELREAQDWSLREFGKKLDGLKLEGLSAAFLSDVELGRRHPSERVLADMARVLGTTVDDLKSYDVRPTVQEIKRLVDRNPAFGFAFRRVLDKDMSPEELLKAIESTKKEK
jgi:transcriptional regulator with XRE-family HTH domain